MVNIIQENVLRVVKLNSAFILLLVIALLTLPCEANDAVQTAAKTALTNLTTRSLGKLYKVRDQAETSELRETVLKACVAGLYAVGDTKNATKVKKGLGGDDFLFSLTTECSSCNGEGSTEKSCSKCKGTGNCQNRKCNDGVVTSPGFDGRSSTRKCSICGGSGKCSNCKGTGNVRRVCGYCNGSKRIINKQSAMASCQEQLTMLTAVNNRECVKESGNEIPVQVGELEDKEKKEKEPEKQTAKVEVDLRGLFAAKNADKQRADEEDKRRTEDESPSEVIRRGCADNKSGTHKLFQEYAFDFAKYFRWRDRETTSFQKNRIFDGLVRKGFESRLYKDYVRVWFALVPDGLSFVVSDVQEISFRTSGVKAYSVKLELLSCDSDKNNGVESWQNKDLLRCLKEQRLFERRVSLLISENAEDVSNWQKGKVIVSKGWIYDIEIIDAIITYDNGSKRIDRRMGFGYDFGDFVFRSMAERAAFE